MQENRHSLSNNGSSDPALKPNFSVQALPVRVPAQQVSQWSSKAFRLSTHLTEAEGASTSPCEPSDELEATRGSAPFITVVTLMKRSEVVISLQPTQYIS